LRAKFLLFFAFFFSTFVVTLICFAERPAVAKSESGQGGIIFHCNNEQAQRMIQDLTKYLAALKIQQKWVRTFQNKKLGRLQFSMNRKAFR
jgi:hypothetical protein